MPQGMSKSLSIRFSDESYLIKRTAKVMATRTYLIFGDIEAS